VSLQTTQIPEQTPVPWGIAFAVSWGSLRRRLLRSLITMFGVVLGIAFLSYMLVNENLLSALVAFKDDRLNVLLQKAGVDIFSNRGADAMTILLIGLSLFTCLVGIINAMLMAVSERIREIGTLKCLGAQDAFIVKTYFIESSLQGAIGTVLGVLIGLVVAVLINGASYGRFVAQAFPAWPVLKSMSIGLVIGSLMSVAASILPAYMAARKEPVDAMRVEE
jgi:putative ABC transport system permease protein